MTPAIVLSALILVGAVSWSMFLIATPTEWRMRVLAALLAFVGMGLFFSLFAQPANWTASAALGVSAVVLLTVALLGRIIVRQSAVEIDLGLQKAYLEELFDQSPEAIVLFGNDGRIMKVNPAFTRLFGHRSDEARGKLLDDLIVPRELRKGARELMQKAAAGARVNAESLRRRKDGSLVDVSILGTPIKAGRQTAILGVFSDLTERRRAHETVQRLEKAVETTQIGVTVTDLEGHIVYTNRADAEMHGYTMEELIGQDVQVFAPESLRKPMTTEQLEQMKSWRRESVNIRKDGGEFPVHLMSDVVRSVAGEAIGVVTTCEDITKRKEGERALRESEERYALAALGSHDGLWDWNLDTGEVYYSDRWKEMLGYDAEQLAPTIDAWLELINEEDIELVRAALDGHLEGTSPQFENEHRVKHQDGTHRWVLSRGIAVRDHDGKPHRMAGSLTDITRRKTVEQQLARDALYDPLTGLPNRAFFTNLLDRSIKRAKRRKGHEFAVLFLDLDRFKLINDSLGHNAGDQLLVAVSQRLVKCLRPGDIVARLAGDEFSILLDEIKEISDATRVAERILDEMKSPFGIGGRELFASISIGVASSQGGRRDPEHLLRDADTAMYRAKSRGKARFEVFDEDMHQRAVEQLKIENKVRQALDNGEFRLVYLPVVAMDSEQITGFEALLRWEHPEQGLVPPSEFVPIAEETGLIVPIGWWVLRQACSQMAGWVERFPNVDDLSVSVNVSAKQLRQADLAERIGEALQTAGLDSGRLKLEITESVLMDDPDFNSGVIRRLNEIGVQVQIDDFGTGYTSLTYLNRFDIDTLKIDRSVISRVGVHEDRSVIVQAMITFARHLGINVIAEGVETPEQSRQLQLLQCEHAQGFLYSHPVPPEEAEALLRDHQD